MNDRRKFMIKSEGSFPDGLIHLWRLDGNLNDSVGGIHGIEDGNITYSAGKFSKDCARFTESSNIRVDLNESLSKYTVQAWVKLDYMISDAPIIYSRTSTVNTYGFYFDTYVENGSPRNAIALAATTSNNGQIGWNWGTYTNWQLYTFTYDGSSAKCYINGVQQSVKFTYGSYDRKLLLRDNTRIGRDTYSSGRNINGYIQQLMIWNKELTQAEINKYYNNGNGLFI